MKNVKISYIISDKLGVRSFNTIAQLESISDESVTKFMYDHYNMDGVSFTYKPTVKIKYKKYVNNPTKVN